MKLNQKTGKVKQCTLCEKNPNLVGALWSESSF